MSVYPEKIGERCLGPQHIGRAENENGAGKSASFVCGSFIRFSVNVDGETKTIGEIRSETNGCGYLIAAAETLSAMLTDTALTDLKGARDPDLATRISRELGEFPDERVQCGDLVLEAFHSALANYREHVIEEFQGEKALICTCFGVSEETIIKVIEENKLNDVADVSAVCNAGLGCGSCQMLIRELIEGRAGGV